MSDTDLLRRLRKYAVPVIEIAGWENRGAAFYGDQGSVNHHTAGPRRGAMPSLGILVNGRSDLPGPLCNVGLGRDGVARLIAAGRANHAGTGSWHGHSGNSHHHGLEWEHCGYPDEPITEAQIDVAARIHAAFADGNYAATEVCQHYEWAPHRKIDFVKPLLNPDTFRGRVATYLRRGSAQPPKPTAPVWHMPPFPGHTLRKGERSQAVAVLKVVMVAAGYGEGLNIEGDSAKVFGAGTEAAVKRLQADYYKLTGKAGVPSGVVGPLTWNWISFLIHAKRKGK